MMDIILLCGGGGTEHDISLISANHIHDCLKDEKDIQLTRLEMTSDKQFKNTQGKLVDFYNLKPDYVIPCLHGWPGETGDIQSYLEMRGISYLGSNSEASKICFNKVTTKLWLSSIGVPNTPFVILTSPSEETIAEMAFDDGEDIFIKAASQGSSVGCYHVTKREDIAEAVKKAFTYSPYVLVEKTIKGRELEVAVYEHNGELIITKPGEILLPENDFYSYEEKYSNESHTSTVITAEGITQEQIQTITENALYAFTALKLRDLARVDFFLTERGDIYLNEINTFPGLTPISMFPKMMEAEGDSFKEFLINKIKNRKL